LPRRRLLARALAASPRRPALGAHARRARPRGDVPFVPRGRLGPRAGDAAPRAGESPRAIAERRPTGARRRKGNPMFETAHPTSKTAEPAPFGIEVANALSIARPTLGNAAGVALYRLVRLVALEDIIGRGASGTAYLAGKKLGKSLGL